MIEIEGIAMIGLMALSFFTIYIIIAIYLTKALANRTHTSKGKFAIACICMLIFILIPTWDVLLGRLYFTSLCINKGGITVNNKIELPMKYRGNKGSLVFIEPNRNIKKKLLAEIATINTEVEDESNSLFNIRKTKKLVYYKDTNELLGSYTYFIYFGGWLVNSTGLHVSGDSCPSVKQASFSKLLESIFIVKK